MRFAITSVAAFAASAAALSVTSPAKHDDVDLSKSTTIEWNSVSSDPSSFDIYLVNMNDYPNVNKLVAENVKTSDGSYTLKDVSGVDSGSGFQVNLISNDDMNSGILAQSAQFNVESSSSSTTTASTTSASSTSSSSSTSSGSSTTTKGKTTTSGTSSPTTTTTSTSSRKHTTSCTTRTSSHASTTTSPSTTLGTSTAASSSSSSTATPSETVVPPNGAGSLKVPVAAAGSLLMSLFLVL